jgi:hypothetical protein
MAGWEEDLDGAGKANERGVGGDMKVIRLYHGTSDTQARKIKSRGMSNPLSSAGWYMFSTDRNDAVFHSERGDGKPVVVVVDVPIDESSRWVGYPYLWKPLHSGGGAFKGTWYAIRDDIPPEFVKRIEKVSEREMRDSRHREGKITLRAASIPRKPVLLDTRSDNFSIRGINNRRFMFYPKSHEVMFGGSDISRSSHAEEWYDLGATGKFDDAVRGWIGYGGRYKHGIIHFAPEITGSDFNDGFDTLEMFFGHGASKETVVRNFGKRGEEPLGDILFPSQVKVAARPIYLNRSSIRKLVDSLFDEIKRGATLNPTGPLGSFWFEDEITVRDVRGSQRRVVVQAEGRDSSSGKFILGAGFGRVKRTNEPAVVVYLNSAIYVDALFSTLRQAKAAVFSALSHELTHAADVFDDEKTVKPRFGPAEEKDISDLGDYYNRPSEVRAYMRELFEDMSGVLSSATGRLPSNNVLRSLILSRPHWKQISPYLTERNKKLVLRGVYKAIQDLVDGMSSTVRMAARPIRIDKAQVKRKTEEIAEDIWRRLKRMPQDEPVGRFVLNFNVVIRNTDGENIETVIVVKMQPSSSVDLVPGGGTGKAVRTGQSAIVVLLNGRYNPPVFNPKASRFMDELYGILLHEFTHIADKYKGGGPTTRHVKTLEEMDAEKYYNRPSEVRAYMQQIVDEVRKYFPKIRKHFDRKESVHLALRTSQTWKEIEPYLNRRNRNRILNAVWNSIQDLMEG